MSYRKSDESRMRVNRAYHIDQMAHKIACEIDDIYAMGGLHVAQRTSRIQLRIGAVLEEWVIDALIRNNIPEETFK